MKASSLLLSARLVEIHSLLNLSLGRFFSLFAQSHLGPHSIGWQPDPCASFLFFHQHHPALASDDLLRPWSSILAAFLELVHKHRQVRAEPPRPAPAHPSNRSRKCFPRRSKKAGQPKAHGAVAVGSARPNPRHSNPKQSDKGCRPPRRVS